jgi:hypothetical protein
MAAQGDGLDSFSLAGLLLVTAVVTSVIRIIRMKRH